jgi:hypothetical protein
MESKTGHEVMVCKNGPIWTLRLRRTDAGLMELRETYPSERDAIRTAHEFVLARSKTHPTEEWFCLASEI